MRLFLQCAKSASYAGFETIAYEFLTQVFEIYESDVAESKAQFRALNEIIATLQTLAVFSGIPLFTLFSLFYYQSYTHIYTYIKQRRTTIRLPQRLQSTQPNCSRNPISAVQFTCVLTSSGQAEANQEEHHEANLYETTRKASGYWNAFRNR